MASRNMNLEVMLYKRCRLLWQPCCSVENSKLALLRCHAAGFVLADAIPLTIWGLHPDDAVVTALVVGAFFERHMFRNTAELVVAEMRHFKLLAFPGIRSKLVTNLFAVRCCCRRA